MIAHGDYCDYSNYVVRIQDLTSDVEQLVDFAGNVPSTGGGDMPEVYTYFKPLSFYAQYLIAKCPSKAIHPNMDYEYMQKHSS